MAGACCMVVLLTTLRTGGEANGVACCARLLGVGWCKAGRVRLTKTRTRKVQRDPGELP